MKINSMIFLLAVFVMAVPQAFAYEIYLCGDDKIEWEGTPRIRASAVGFPEGHTRSAALQAVVDRWNSSPADFHFNLTWNDGNVGVYNDQNEIWFTADEDFMDGAPAFTIPSDDCGDWSLGDGNSEIEEMDVVFACDAAWRTHSLVLRTEYQFHPGVRWHTTAVPHHGNARTRACPGPRPRR
jgi:hypothetical protein